LNIDFEPFKPINTSLYLCDNKFHTEALNELLEDDARFGFVVMDGNGCLFGTLTGNTREVIHKFSVDLPKKHGRGGQSALRFSRLREEKRHNYVRRVAEQMSNLFITNAKPNVAGLVLAGSAEFKNDLAKSDLFDQRLRPLILKIVDVSYGDFNGFNQAIELAADVLGNVRFIHEKQILEKFFEDISKEGGKTCYGYIETLKSLEAGAVETLIVYEDLPMLRWKLVDPAGGTPRSLTTGPNVPQRSMLPTRRIRQKPRRLIAIIPAKSLRWSITWPLRNGSRTITLVMEQLSNSFPIDLKKEVSLSKDSVASARFSASSLTYPLWTTRRSTRPPTPSLGRQAAGTALPSLATAKSSIYFYF